MLVSRPEFEPHVVEGSVEAWIGRHFRDRFARDSAHCDFWRAHPAGVFFLVRGYDEDASTSVLPATIVDITLPIWRIGEAMLYASRIARAYAENPEIEIHCRFTNLKDRRLGSLDKMRHFFMQNEILKQHRPPRTGGHAVFIFYVRLSGCCCKFSQFIFHRSY